MPHKTPSFWYPEDSKDLPIQAKMLKPLACLYTGFYRLHQASVEAKKVAIPIVCIGNLSAGGTGKTPTCVSLATSLRDAGHTKNPFFLMRGYGGSERGPLLVNPEKHTAWDVGDEALILAQAAPTIVSADRSEGAELALSQGADLVIMDDGLQNPGIYKDIKIIVINGEMGFGNGFVMPAGPLREPLAAGLDKADAFLIIGEEKADIRSLLPSSKPVFTAHLETNTNALPPKDQKYLAFAGLGYPDKFFNYLTDDLGYELVETLAFADHCPYERRDLMDLRKKAKALDAALITTEKDFLRLPRGHKDDVYTLPVSMHFDDPTGLKDFLSGMLNSWNQAAA